MKKFGLGYSDQYSDDLYRYLRSKGYEDEILKESGLVTIDERRGGYDKFWNRVIFPIMDVNNRVIGFGGRVMGDGKPKYLADTPRFIGYVRQCANRYAELKPINWLLDCFEEEKTKEAYF